MALTIPKIVTGFIVNNDPAQRMFNGLVNAVNPVVAFLNANFAQASDGSLQALKNLVVPSQTVNGNQTINGAQTVNGSQTVTGTTTANSIVNGSGFKNCGPLNTFTGSMAAGGFYNCTAGVTGIGNFTFPFAGSLVGVMVNFTSPAVTTTYRIYTTGPWGDSFVTYNNTAAVNGGTIYASYFKGQYPFVAGNGFLCKAYSSAASSSFAVNVVPIFEFAS